MKTRRWQYGVILGAFLVALIVMTLPRSAAAWGGRVHRFTIRQHNGFSTHHHSLRRHHLRHRISHFDHRVQRHRRHHRFRRHGFYHGGHVRNHHRQVRHHLKLHRGNTVFIIRR